VACGRKHARSPRKSTLKTGVLNLLYWKKGGGGKEKKGRLRYGGRLIDHLQQPRPTRRGSPKLPPRGKKGKGGKRKKNLPFGRGGSSAECNSSKIIPRRGGRNGKAGGGWGGGGIRGKTRRQKGGDWTVNTTLGGRGVLRTSLQGSCNL